MKEQAERRLTLAWQRSDALFNIVRRESILRQPIPWRHPFIFYVGHLPAFAWNQICRGILGRGPLNSRFDELFSRGIDPDLDSGICHDHPDVPEQWPDLNEVWEYRDRARTAVLNSIEDVPRAAGRDIMALKGRVLTMVLEHECMHQETLLYMVQELLAEEKNPPPDLPEHVFGKSMAPAEVEIPAGEAKLGASFDSLDFGWDNEFPERRARVPRFRIDVTPVTNGQFLDFVESGAYANPAYWRGEDWLWKSKFDVRHPHFWIRREGQWFYRTLFDFVELERVLSWPVYVSLAEALAYARWKGRRLPTEAEFHRAAYCTPRGDEFPYPWGRETPSPTHGNFNFTHWAPTPVGIHSAGCSAWGVYDLTGDGWEWTETPFAPFPGFEPFIKTYPEYSADFFDGKHYVLKGASWATTVDLVRPSFRNWFQARYRYVFAKFRCVTEIS